MKHMFTTRMLNSRTSGTAPVFRWAGSKRKVLPQLLQCVPKEYARYVEPFAGSGCLFFALRPSIAVLGDINADLIGAYLVIRDHPRLVARAAHGFKRDRDTYYRLRSTAPDSLIPVERAARFVYLNRYCFNGVYRVNRSGLFNVPMGTRTGGIPCESDFYRCSLALKRAELRGCQTTDF